MTKLDPRRNAYRPDLAAASLQGIVRAQTYTAGEVRQVSAPQMPVRVAARFDAPLATEALAGELVTIFEQKEGWGWVQLQGDGYVGYMPLDGLTTLPEPPTHKVAARLTYVYSTPDMKLPPFMRLGFSSAVTIVGSEGRFWNLSRGGYVFGDHLVGIEERARDFVRVAERFVGAPYLWGGKTATGIDCSGLVQVSLQAAGIPCPRDSDMQMEEVGESLDPANLDAIQRGDLLFWKGHVALAQSGDWMVHASGFHMEVVVEPIRRAIERIAESHGPLLAIRRPALEKAPSRPAMETKKAAAELAKVIPVGAAARAPSPPPPPDRDPLPVAAQVQTAAQTPAQTVSPAPPGDKPPPKPPAETKAAPQPAPPPSDAANKPAPPPGKDPQANAVARLPTSPVSAVAQPAPPASAPSRQSSEPPRKEQDATTQTDTDARNATATRAIWRGFSMHGDPARAAQTTAQDRPPEAQPPAPDMPREAAAETATSPSREVARKPAAGLEKKVPG